MKQLSFSQLVITILLAMTTLHTTNASASVYRGKIELQVGETYEVSAVPTSGYTASGSFSKSGTCFNITANGSYYCMIEGNSAGKGTLSYRGTAARSGSWSTESYDYYWDIEVKSNTPGPTPNPDTDSDPDEEIDEPTDDWCKSGNYSISWFNKNKTDFTISTNKELAGIAYLVNSGFTEFEGCTIKLCADIDLSGKKWIQCQTFKGAFDGQGHKISGIFLGNDYDAQSNFGFFQKLENAKITNIFIEGKAIFNFFSKLVERVNMGGLSGLSEGNTEFERCYVNVDIAVEIDKTIEWYTNIYIGGICGSSEEPLFKSDLVFNLCSFTGRISLNDNLETYNPYLVHKHIAIGGIIAGSAKNISCCEVISPAIELKSKTYDNSSRQIYGIGYSNKIEFCRSIIRNIIISESRLNVYVICGIGFNAINSYSSISALKIEAREDDSSENRYLFGEISTAINETPKFCYGNNDTDITSNKTLERINDGSTAFSSEQMQSLAFLEELNMYSILEMDGPIWSQSAEGGYPYVTKLCETSAVELLRIVDSKNTSVYTLSGQRIVAPRKGINIVGGKKVIIR